MPVYLLGPDPELWPPVELSEPDGLLAVGGDLTVPRLLSAYANGIFPWYNEDCPILWWSPNPRCVLIPQRVHVGKRLARALRACPYTVTMDTAFDVVIRACAGTARPGQPGTWLLPEMISAYEALHEAGYAHSVEVWADADQLELVGGLYGVSLGRAFFGESMFHHADNASKAGLIALCQTLGDWGFTLLDCQQTTPHILALGGEELARQRFYTLLAEALDNPTHRGPWHVQMRAAC